MHISILINIHTCKFNLLLISFLFISRKGFGPIPLGAPGCVSLFFPATGRREAKSCADQGSVALERQQLLVMGLVRPTRTIPQRLLQRWSGSRKQGQHKVCQFSKRVEFAIGVHQCFWAHVQWHRPVSQLDMVRPSYLIMFRRTVDRASRRENFLILNSFPRI